MSEKEQSETLVALEELDKRRIADTRRASLLEFIQAVDEDYIVGVHHEKLAKLLEDMAYGRNITGEDHVLDRLTVSIAPRMGKSMITSIYFPAWFIGNFPKKKIMAVSHTADLAVDFGRKVRNLVSSDAYQLIFPGVELAQDSKSAGRWNTNQGGEYYAAGVGSALAGRGGDLIVLDDPHNEQEILAGNLDIFDKAYDWYRYGLRTRLQAGGRIAIVATRWAKNDLIGNVIKAMTKDEESDQWEVVEFPAILNEGDRNTEKSLWPEMWTLDSLKRTRASMPPFQWHAQYQQNPTGEHAALLPKKWWRKWKEDKPPECTYVIMSLDTAAEKNNRADFTALTTWGVFDYVDPGGDGVEHSHIMLLDAVNERMEYPSLKKMTLRKWEEFDPDWFIVEKKNSGSALYQEMRANGLPVQEFTPNRATGDKIARINAITDIFSSGMVWYPVGHRWAEEVVDQAADFPGGKHDDLVDSLSMAITRFRTGGFIRLPSDRIWDDDEDFQPISAHYY